jgi:hypothetical protein
MALHREESFLAVHRSTERKQAGGYAENLCRCAVEAAVPAAKAKVIPKVQAARLPLQLLLRREGGDDFFEARVAAQRVPQWLQF